LFQLQDIRTSRCFTSFRFPDGHHREPLRMHVPPGWKIIMEENNLRYREIVEVRQCPHGKGLFALVDMSLPTMIVEIHDVVFTSAPTSPSRRYALRVGENDYWDECPPESDLYWSNFIDHSNEPNTAFIFDMERKTSWFVTTKPVKNGEELFIKYDDYYPTNPTRFDRRNLTFLYPVISRNLPRWSRKWPLSLTVPWAGVPSGTSRR